MHWINWPLSGYSLDPRRFTPWYLDKRKPLVWEAFFHSDCTWANGQLAGTPSQFQLCCGPLITRLSDLLRFSSLPPLSYIVRSLMPFEMTKLVASILSGPTKKEPCIDAHPMRKYVHPDSLHGGAGSAPYLGSTPPMLCMESWLYVLWVLSLWQ